MRKSKSLAVLAAVVIFCGAAFAADEYKIDPNHSSIGFSVNHMVVSTVHGRFTEYDGKIVYDANDISKSSVSVNIKTASINTDNSQRDTHLRSGDFLDATNHPEITFQSKSVEKKGSGYVAHGTLTIRGVSKDVDLPFELKGPLTVGNKTILGAEATLTINRMDYGVSWSKTLDQGQLIVGNEVKIEINAEADKVPAAGK